MDENTQAMYEQYMDDIRNLQTMNNNWSAEQAQRARDYEQWMSNTAHQREMEDLRKAGLNPILAAGGSGATTTSGNAAQRGDSNISAMASLMSKMLDASIEQSRAAYGNSADSVWNLTEALKGDTTDEIKGGSFGVSSVKGPVIYNPLTTFALSNEKSKQNNAVTASSGGSTPVYVNVSSPQATSDAQNLNIVNSRYYAAVKRLARRFMGLTNADFNAAEEAMGARKFDIFLSRLLEVIYPNYFERNNYRRGGYVYEHYADSSQNWSGRGGKF